MADPALPKNLAARILDGHLTPDTPADTQDTPR